MRGKRVWASLGMVLLGAAAAQAEAPRSRSSRKPPPPDLASEAYDTFVAAFASDRVGDRRGAADLYRDSIREQPTAEAYYNLAELARAMERWQDATAAYTQYLALAPNAADRAAVMAAIATIAARPSTTNVEAWDLLPGTVFIDGTLAGPSPQLLTLSPGWHAIDRLTAGGFVHVRELVTAHDNDVADLSLPPEQAQVTQDTDRVTSTRSTGNVVLSQAEGFHGGWAAEIDGGPYRSRIAGRLALTRGSHSVVLHSSEGHTCKPVSFEVSGKPGVTYVYLEATKERDPRGRTCFAATARVQQVGLP